MNKLIQTLIENRGYTEDFLNNIEKPDHRELLDIDVLTARLNKAFLAGEKVVILPDFDMDGIMSGTLGYAGLAEMGFNVSLFVPDVTGGYGFKPATIDELKRRFPTVAVILTCDTGVTCYEGVSYASSLGIDVLITDHHTPGENFPSAFAVVDPMRSDDPYEHPHICGAYVLYQVLLYYARTYCDVFMQEQIERLQVFAGIGTISDTMPLLYENRHLVRNAVAILNSLYNDGQDNTVLRYQGRSSVYTKVFGGLTLLLRELGMRGKLPSGVDEDTVGFYIAPMFNSVKRMDGDMHDAFGVFIYTVPENSLKAITNLFVMNDMRRELVDKYYHELETDHQPFSPYIFLTDASKGIRGLLAQKIIGTTGLPALVLSHSNDGIYEGSGRSPVWYPFLTRTREYCYSAGHEGAFGCSSDNLSELVAFLTQDVAAVSKTTDHVEFKPDYKISMLGDGDTDVDPELFFEYVEAKEKYRPFGKEFPRPLGEFRFRPCDVDVRSLSQGKHLKLIIPGGMNVICWNQGHYAAKLEENRFSPVSVFGDLSVNEWNDTKTVQFLGDLETGGFQE